MKKLLVLPAALLAVALLLAACSSSGKGGSGGGTGVGTSGVSSPPARSTSTSTSPAGASSSAGSGSSSPAGSGGSGPAPTLRDFRVADLTWVGSHGWALGEADCLSGGGQCDAIEQTTDGGRTWSSLPAPKAQTYLGVSSGCQGNCLNGLRFATDRIGWAYGPQAFYTTRDGGRTWTRSAGGAYALESLDETVIRVVYPQGLPGSFQVQVANVDLDGWKTVALPGGPDIGYGTLLGRAPGISYLLVQGHPAGGGQDARSKLYTSTDGGRTWAARGEPCPQNGTGPNGEVDSTMLTVAPDGSATVLCYRRIAGGGPFTATAPRNGTFRAGSRSALGSAMVTGFGAASSSVIVIVLADTFRSADGGRSFARLAANAGSSPGDPVYVGFSTTTLGYAISADRHTLFTTTDAGRTWTSYRFG